MKLKLKYILYIITLVNLAVFQSCIDDPDLPSEMINAKAPEVKTVKTENKTATSIEVIGEVLKENGMSVTAFGAYWSKTSPIDTTTAKRVIGEKEEGEFRVRIDHLEPNQEYHVAAFAMNSKGIGLGEEQAFQTISGLGTVNIHEIKDGDIKATTAIIGGTIVDKGEGEIIERGVYWRKASSTKIDSIKSSINEDSFTCTIPNLESDMEYAVKIYAKNNFGIFSSSERKFTTKSGKPKVANLTTISLGIHDATFRAEITEEGESEITERGFYWKENFLPTKEDHEGNFKAGIGIGVFEGKIENLEPGRQYHLLAYAINSFGVSYSKDTVFYTKSDIPSVVILEDPVIAANGTVMLKGEVKDEGEGGVIEYGFCWSSANNLPEITDSFEHVGSGKEAYQFALGGLKGNTTYYARAYAKNEAGKIGYSQVINFKTQAVFEYMPTFNKDRIQGSASFFHTENGGFLLGGDVGPSFTNELWWYEYDRKTWAQLQSYPEENISGQSSVYVNSRVYVFGGKDNVNNTYSNRFYSYSPYNNNWTQLNVTGTPDPVAFAAGCALGKSAYFIGGIRQNAISSEVKQYTSQDDKWITRANIPEAQYNGVALVLNDFIYAGLGMTDQSGTVNNKKLWVSKDNGASWNACASIPNEASTIMGGVVYRESLFVIDNGGQMWEYITKTDTWSKKIHLTVLNNKVHCIYISNDDIYVGLGNNAGAFIRYNPSWDN